MSSVKTLLEAANAVVTRISTEDGIARHSAGGGAIFVDVRDSAAIDKTGTIEGAHRIPRGFLEFSADRDFGFFNEILANKDADFYLVCGLGGQAALAGKTMKEMGYTSVTNVGGMGDWIKAGGPTEAA